MRAALVKDNVVVNVIEIPDDYNSSKKDAYSPPEGQELNISIAQDVSVGSRFVDGVWEPPLTEPAPDPIEERLNALETEVRGMKKRAANVSVTDPDAVKVKDAITGPPEK